MASLVQSAKSTVNLLNAQRQCYALCLPCFVLDQHPHPTSPQQPPPTLFPSFRRVLESAPLSEMYTSCAHDALQSFSLQAVGSHGLSASALANLLVPYTPWGDGIGRHVGSGGKGAVFKCTLGDGRQVAVKRMVLKDMEMVWDFVTEGCFSAELFAAGAGLEVHSISFHMHENGRDVRGEIVMQLADMDLGQERVLMVEQVRQGLDGKMQMDTGLSMYEVPSNTEGHVLRGCCA